MRREGEFLILCPAGGLPPASHCPTNSRKTTNFSSTAAPDLARHGTLSNSRSAMPAMVTASECFSSPTTKHPSPSSAESSPSARSNAANFSSEVGEKLFVTAQVSSTAAASDVMSNRGSSRSIARRCSPRSFQKAPTGSGARQGTKIRQRMVWQSGGSRSGARRLNRLCRAIPPRRRIPPPSRLRNGPGRWIPGGSWTRGARRDPFRAA